MFRWGNQSQGSGNRWKIMVVQLSFSTLWHFWFANVGFDPKPVTNPWFTYVNPGFRNQNPGFGTPKPGFVAKPGFAQTRDEPVTNPWFTRDNPWFFSRVETPETNPIFTRFLMTNFDHFGLANSINSRSFQNLNLQRWGLQFPRSRLTKPTKNSYSSSRRFWSWFLFFQWVHADSTSIFNLWINHAWPARKQRP